MSDNLDEKIEQKFGPKDFSVQPNEYSSFDKTYAILSGKGGVGKSLVTSLLAVELNKKGYTVGILDADITGPSIPKYFGITSKARGSEIGINPCISKEGIRIMSANLILDNPSDPVVWRGPVISSVVKQFYTDVVWGNIDVLLIDMPPGTGDVPLTVFQSLNVDGAIVVTSPQDLSKVIVEKSVKMAGMLDKEIIGIVENMSYFHCPDNDKDYKIFGESHIDEIASKYNIDTIAKIPINPIISELSDNGNIEEYSEHHLDKIVGKIENN